MLRQFRRALVLGTLCLLSMPCLTTGSAQATEIDTLLAKSYFSPEAKPLDEPLCSAVCGPPGCTWIRLEALMWWTNGANAPPLVSTGLIGDPGTQVLFGGEPINDGMPGRSPS